VELHSFLTAVLGGGEWAALRSGRFTPWKKPDVPIELLAVWAPRVGMDV
jgi:hypothetical protein